MPKSKAADLEREKQIGRKYLLTAEEAQFLVEQNKRNGLPTDHLLFVDLRTLRRVAREAAIDAYCDQERKTVNPVVKKAVNQATMFMLAYLWEGQKPAPTEVAFEDVTRELSAMLRRLEKEEA